MEETNELECAHCGSTERERSAYASRYPREKIKTALIKCLFCSDYKCCMCDMGHDVPIGGCDADDIEPAEFA